MLSLFFSNSAFTFIICLNKRRYTANVSFCPLPEECSEMINCPVHSFLRDHFYQFIIIFPILICFTGRFLCCATRYTFFCKVVTCQRSDIIRAVSFNPVSVAKHIFDTNNQIIMKFGIPHIFIIQIFQHSVITGEELINLAPVTLFSELLQDPDRSRIQNMIVLV